MISTVLQKYIPSGSYVEYLKETGHEFTDFEEAGILWHVIEDREIRMEELLKLAERTRDARLKGQIEAAARDERDSLAVFRDNSAGNAVYVVEYYDEEEPDFYTPIAGFAADYETAYAIGLRTKNRFTISKRVLYSRKNEIRNRPEDKAYINPYMEHDKDWDIREADEEILRSKYEIDPIGYDERSSDYSYGALTFNGKGRLTEYYVNKADQYTNNTEGNAVDIMEKQYSGNMFYNSFIEFPFPFEQGDFVKICTNSEDGCKTLNGYKCVIGIVDTSREEYEAFRVRARQMYVDAGDAGASVQFMYEDGSFMHEHVMPLFLERAEPDPEAAWYDLAMNAQWMLKGEGSLDFFLYEYDNLRRRNNE